MTRLPPRPVLDWVGHAPRSVAAADGYFSQAGGLAESRAVFLAGCGLPEAWRGRTQFAIGELGFGTGLNALAAWDAWRVTRAPGAVLHFVSVEGFPLTREEAARALSPFDEIATLRARLLARWPARVRGAQRLWFDDDGFALTVVHAPVDEALSRLRGAFDAWFLDGFAPARNDAMWRADALAQVAALSAPGARAASYTVAGHVRRSLADAGFTVEKRAGFAGKRERLEASQPGAAPTASATPSVAIIGAGIAGACVHAALRRRGIRAALFDADGAASAASGNPVAIVSPRLDRAESGAARFWLGAYLHALEAYGDAFEALGVEHRPRDDRERAALADLCADPPLPPEHMRAHGDGAFFAGAGIVRPSQAIDALLAGADVRRVRIDAVERAGAPWRLCSDGAAVADADVVVFANGGGLGAFAQTAWLPLEFTRGQLEWGPAPDAPRTVVEGGPYVAPFADGMAFGATFDRLASPMSVTPDAQSRARNLAALQTLAPDLAARIDPLALTSRAAVRAATPDRLPIAGVAPDASADEGATHSRLWLLGGLGSRGFLAAPLLGETIASAILGEPQALDAEALAAVDPARLLRRLRRRA
jgi:tRNA 5-methylaminomethyl-2-thiouridine biosynthesis bifunctional protein